MPRLSDKLRAAAKGVEEWRVADPKTGSYCMAFSRLEYTNPVREARQWLEHHREHFPHHEFSSYEVQRVMAQDDHDRLMLEAADEIDRLTKALDDIAHSPRTKKGIKQAAREALSRAAINAPSEGA